MKHAANAEDKKEREAQAASYKTAEWIKVTFANGNTRMIRRKEYNALTR